MARKSLSHEEISALLFDDNEQYQDDLQELYGNVSYSDNDEKNDDDLEENFSHRITKRKTVTN